MCSCSLVGDGSRSLAARGLLDQRLTRASGCPTAAAAPRKSPLLGVGRPTFTPDNIVNGEDSGIRASAAHSSPRAPRYRFSVTARSLRRAVGVQERGALKSLQRGRPSSSRSAYRSTSGDCAGVAGSRSPATPEARESQTHPPHRQDGPRAHSAGRRRFVLTRGTARKTAVKPGSTAPVRGAGRRLSSCRDRHVRRCGVSRAAPGVRTPTRRACGARRASARSHWRRPHPR